jgi:DNA-binding NtrC family response regulator
MSEEQAVGKLGRPILIVDDEWSMREVLVKVLAEAGYTAIAQAETGPQALEMLRALPYDVVILDKNLPGLDGIEVLREAKRLRPRSEFILITGYASTDSAIDAVNLEAFGYLTKPLDDLAQIETMLSWALDRVLAREELHQLIDGLRRLAERLEANAPALESLQVAEALGTDGMQLADQELLGTIRALRDLCRRAETIQESAWRDSDPPG